MSLQKSCQMLHPQLDQLWENLDLRIQEDQDLVEAYQDLKWVYLDPQVLDTRTP